MFETIKGIGTQLTTMASTAVDGVTSTVKDGANSVAGAASAAASTLNEKAIRAAVEQMRTVLHIAADDLKSRPVLNLPVTLTATIDIGFTALEMQVVIEPGTEIPGNAADTGVDPSLPVVTSAGA